MGLITTTISGTVGDIAVTGAISGSSALHVVGASTFSSTIATTGSVTAGTSFVIGSVDINATDLGKIDGITNGAGLANKALVLNASTDITSGLRSLTGSGDAKFANIHATQFYGGGAGLTSVAAASATTATAVSGTTAQLTTGVETSGYLKVSGSTTLAGDITATCDTVIIQSTNSTDPVLILKNTNTDGNGARLRFVKDAGEAGAATDVAGLIEFYADDANQDQVLFASIEGAVEVATNGQEGGKLVLGVASHDGEMNVGLLLVDGDAEDEIDVIVGNTTTSVTSIAGVVKVGGNVIQASDGGNTITMDTNDNVTVAGGVTAAGLTSTAAISGSSTLHNVGVATFGNSIASSGSITSGVSFIIGSADLNETDLEKLDGITNGAGLANKALVLNASADIASGLRSVTGSGDAKFANIHAAQFYGGGAGLTGVIATVTSLSGTTAQLTTGVETSGYLKVSGSSTFAGDITATCDTVTIQSVNSTDPVLILKNTNTDGNGARLRFVKDAGEAGANTDVSGLIEFYADDANQDQVLFAKIEAAVEQATNGQEGGKLVLGVASHDGEMAEGLVLIDGTVEDEVNVVIGNTTTSVTSIAGVLKVGGNVIQASDGGTTITMDTSDNVTVAGGVTAAGLTSTAAISGSSTLHNVGAATFGATIVATGSITGGGGVTSYGGITVATGHYSGSEDFHTVGHVTLGGDLTASGSISGNSLVSFADLEVGGGDIVYGAGQDATLKITDASGTNIAGRSLTISPGNGTGTGVPGTMTLKVPKVGTSGGTVHSSITIIECTAEGPKFHYDQATALVNDTGVGDIVYMGTGTTAAGKMYYLNSGSAWADASCTLAASGGIGLLGIAIGSNPASNGMLVRGFYDVHSNLSGTFAVGQPVYVTGAPPAAGGKVGINQPSGSGQIVRVVGYCTTTANVIYFNPSSEYIELS